MAAESIAEIFGRVEKRYRRADRAFRTFLTTSGDAKKEALEDLVVWGRSVTNVMEKLRNRIPGFDAWFKPHTAAMREDRGLRQFYLMRSEVLKEGHLDVEKVTMVFDTVPGSFPGDPPAGAKYFISHDEETEKWGWVVQGADGREEKLLFDYPETVVLTDVLLFSSPIDDFGEKHVGTTALEFINRLREMVDELRIMVIRSEGT